MLYIFMGPSCSGKSSLADELKKQYNVQVYSGKDYLRLAKNENESFKLFYEKLQTASHIKNLCSESIIYVVSEKDILSKLNTLENAVIVKFTADPEIIKSRFCKRMNGNLPAPVEKMIERQINDWQYISSKITIDTSNTEPCELIRKLC